MVAKLPFFMVVLRRFLWLLVCFASLGVLVFTQYERGRTGSVLSRIEGWNLAEPQGSSQSSTGWADGGRRWLPAEAGGEGREMVRQAQWVRETGQWNLATVGYDTVPETRPAGVSTWERGGLALLGRVDERLSGKESGRAIESAAVYYDFVWQGMGWCVAVALGFVWARGAGAALLAWGWVTAPTLAGAFTASTLNPHAPIWVFFLAQGGLVLFAERGSGRVPPWVFWAAGVLGALSFAWSADLATVLWLGLSVRLAWGVRGEAGFTGRWMGWTVGGAMTLLVLCVTDANALNWPGDVAQLHGSQVGFVLGLSGLLWSAVVGNQTKWVRAAVSVVSLGLALPWGIAWASPATEFLFTRDPLWARLPGVERVDWRNLGEALVGKGGGIYWLLVAETLLVVILGSGRKMTSGIRGRGRAWGLALVLVVISWIQLRFWPLAEISLLWLLASRWPRAQPSFSERGTGSAALVISLLGLALAWPRAHERGATALSVHEAESIILRDVGHWLRQRQGGAVNFWSPPDSTEAIAFAGDHRGLGSTQWESREGVAAALRLANATSPDEALELVQRRRLQYLILPSWDASLERLVLRSRNMDTMPPSLFLAVLPRFEHPRWLRLVPYSGPVFPGLEAHRVLVFEVVEEQDEVTAFSGLAEALVEIGEVPIATAVARHLESYASDLNALVARAVVAMSTGDQASFRSVLRVLGPVQAAGGDGMLAWDRRVSLATVLAQADQRDLARAVLEGLMSEVDEAGLRALTPNQRLRLIALSRLAQVPFPEASLESTALSLVPIATRRQLPARPPQWP